VRLREGDYACRGASWPCDWTEVGCQLETMARRRCNLRRRCFDRAHVTRSTDDLISLLGAAKELVGIWRRRRRCYSSATDGDGANYG